MNAVTEVEATAVHPPGADLTPYAAAPMQEYRPRIVMLPAEAQALDTQLRECMLAVLRDGVDYGVIPGAGDKKNLLKPGAEKLLQWFGYGHVNERDEIERDADGQRIGVVYRCTVSKEMSDGRKVVIATCEGYAGYDEDRYYISGETARSKAEARERGYARKDGRAPIPSKWETAVEYRAPWNTVLKMAQKRALVGAAIVATAASGLFTQDMEDMHPAATVTVAEAAQASIAALPADVRAALDRWCMGKRWPESAQWTPVQWCAALQAAGFLAAKRERPEPPPAAAETAQEPAPAAAAPAADAPAAAGETWLDGALAAAPGLPTVKACQELWRESAAKVHAGEVEKADAKRVQEILRARMADLRQAPVATLDDDDPWAVKIEALISSHEAEGVLAEISRQIAAGIIDATRGTALSDAIMVRFPQAAPQAAAA